MIPFYAWAIYIVGALVLVVLPQKAINLWNWAGLKYVNFIISGLKAKRQLDMLRDKRHVANKKNKG